MSDLQARVAELEEYTRRIIPARDGTDGWCNYILTSIAAAISRERDYFNDLLAELIAAMQRDFRDETKALLDEALSIRIRGTYQSGTKYVRGDLVVVDGGSFIARCDAPGKCPGADWQLAAKQGQRGVAGPQGERGPAGKTITGWIVDRGSYQVTPRMSDGTLGAPLDLRELFEPNGERDGA